MFGSTETVRSIISSTSKKVDYMVVAHWKTGNGFETICRTRESADDTKKRLAGMDSVGNVRVFRREITTELEEVK